MTALVCRRTTVASALALILLAGGCSGTVPKQDTEQSLVMSASPGTLESLLPPATSDADLTVDRGLAAALDEEFASGEYEDLRSVIALADGRTAYERYFQSAPSEYHHVYSVTKSVLSTLVGIAIADGAIPGVSATLAELLPDKAKDIPKSVANTTLEQLLTMMAGFTSQVPGPTVTDWVADIASISSRRFWWKRRGCRFWTMPEALCSTHSGSPAPQLPSRTSGIPRPSLAPGSGGPWIRRASTSAASG